MIFNQSINHLLVLNKPFTDKSCIQSLSFMINLIRAKSVLGPCVHVSQETRDVFCRVILLFTMNTIPEDDDSGQAQQLYVIPSVLSICHQSFSVNLIHFNQSINKILIQVYPHKQRWPDLPHSNSNFSSSNSPSPSIQGILPLQTNTLALLHLCLPRLPWSSSPPLALHFKLQCFSQNMPIIPRFTLV